MGGLITTGTVVVSAAGLVPWGCAAKGLPCAAAEELPAMVGFARSRFGPLVAGVTALCLGPPGCPDNLVAGRGTSTAVVLATMYGDSETVDTATREHVRGRKPSPLLFFQSVSTSILGHLTRLYGIRGPLVCLSAVGDPAGEALVTAGHVLDDEAVSQVLVVGVESKPNERVLRASALSADDGQAPCLPAGDAAAALLIRRQAEFGSGRPLVFVTGRSVPDRLRPLGWLGPLISACGEMAVHPGEALTYPLRTN